MGKNICLYTKLCEILAISAIMVTFQLTLVRLARQVTQLRIVIQVTIVM